MWNIKTKAIVYKFKKPPPEGRRFLVANFYKESIIRLFDYSISTARARTKSRAQGWREHTNQFRMA